MLNIEFNKNDDNMRLLISEMKRKQAIIAVGGGKEKIKNQHKQGKLTARERIEYVKDQDAYFFEIGLYAGMGMYEEFGGCPAGGVIAGITYVKKNNVLLLQMMPQ